MSTDKQMGQTDVAGGDSDVHSSRNQLARTFTGHIDDDVRTGTERIQAFVENLLYERLGGL